MSTRPIWVAPGKVRHADERGMDTLGQGYLKGVHGNQNKTDVVSLGQTGTGQTPNYQVTTATGEKPPSGVITMKPMVKRRNLMTGISLGR